MREFQIGDYVVSSSDDGIIEIYDAAIDSYIIIDSENQARLIANAVLEICNENIGYSDDY